MPVLIEEFKRYYYTSPKHKRVSRGTPDQDSRPLCASDCPIIQELPNDILENIFSRISLADLITSISVSNDWVVVYASRLSNRFMTKQIDAFSLITITLHMGFQHCLNLLV